MAFDWISIKWPVVQIQVVEGYFFFYPFVYLGDL